MIEPEYDYDDMVMAQMGARIDSLERVIRRAANIMRGGEGVQDQGEAWDKTLRLLDAAVSDMAPND